MRGGIVIMIRTTLRVIFLNEFNSCITLQTLATHDALDTVILVGCYKHAEHCRMITQHLLGTATYNYTTLALCDIAYRLALNFKKVVVVDAVAARKILRY